MDPLERSSSSEVLGPFSLPPSPPSEPPDIRNWFQSYEYESPEPSGLPFGLESHEEDAEQADFSENTRSPLSIEHDLNTLYGSNIQTRKSLPRNLIRDPECLPVPQAEDQGHIQGANFHHIGRNASSLDSILVDKDQRSLDGHVRISKSEIGDSYIPESAVSRMNETLTKDDGSICRFVTRKVISQEDKSLSSHEDDHSNKTAGAPSSWISTRFGKHSQADDKRLSMKKFVKKDNAKEEETSRLNGASREPLAERTNLLYRQLEEMKEAEIPGKWKCPRSKKPRRGPPLKQLRLEYWIL